MSFELLKYLYIITAFQLFFFTIVALAMYPVKKYQYWLAVFLFVEFLNLLLVIGTLFYPFITDNHFFILFSFILEYSLCPAFLIFVIKVSNYKINYSANKALFLIPYIIGFIFIYVPSNLWAKYGHIYHILLAINYYGQAIFYAFLSLIIYKKFQVKMGNYVTQDYIQRLNWLKLVIIGFTLLWVLAFSYNVLGIFSNRNYSMAGYFFEIAYLTSIIIMLFIGAIKPIGISDISQESLMPVDLKTANKYASSSLVANDKEIIINKLNIAEAKNKFYKTPNITLKALADDLKVQAKYLSQVINENWNQNFCEYINTLRINDAKQQLSNPKNDYKTILEIIYDTGFNSKSVFNTVFKKQVGITPSAFRSEKQKAAL
ncbi:MAG: helix-turn-helix transcriptional regulator [Salinivirgaceae bacterium]|jgi:AraC-like DNA-binding protein|nr:helix-turn-helix transcriptional regulator [Salinivirgaceae bacterium]